MKYICLSFTTLFFIACSYKSDNPEIQSLYEEVMLVHDEVMPEMSTIYRLKKQIKKQDSIDSLGMALLTELESADEAMMAWMAAFKPDKNASIETQQAYLKTEKEKISKVSRTMKSSILKAQNYVQK
jgi:hypothetical protein